MTYSGDRAAFRIGDQDCPLSVEDIRQATLRNSAFADDTVAGLSRLIGLTGGQSQLHYQDSLKMRHLLITCTLPSSRPLPAPFQRVMLHCAIFRSRQLAHAVGLSGELAGASFGRNTGYMADAEPRRGLQRWNARHSSQWAGRPYDHKRLHGGIQIPQRALCWPPRDRTAKNHAPAPRTCSNPDSSRSRKVQWSLHTRKFSPPDFRRWTFLRTDLSGPRRFSLFSSCIWWLQTQACGTSMFPCGRSRARTSSMTCLVHGLPPLNRRGCLSFLVSTTKPVRDKRPCHAPTKGTAHAARTAE
jgi:hypothetical protein